jgi:putative aminopeptidase FrvX
MGVRPGLPITPVGEFRVIVPGKRYSGKAFDDRVALAVITDLLARIRLQPGRFKHLNLQFAATVQEEVGMRGAMALASALKPDVTLNLEAGIARDYPTQFAQGTGPALGQGPTVFVFDGSMVPNAHLVNFIRDVANQRRIPFQWESELNYGQDASRLQCAPGGSMAINLGIPVRYPHSHHSLMDRKDYDLMLALLENLLASMGQAEIEAMR